MANGVSGKGVAVLFLGTLFAYSGVKGYSITKTFGQLLAGQKPTNVGLTGSITSAASGSPVTVAASQSAAVNAQLVAETLRGIGASPAAIAGYIGNFLLESGLSTTSYNANEGAIGWAQWEGGRRAALQAYAGAHGLQETDAQAQAGYLRAELLTSESAARILTFTQTDPGNAAALIDQYYERSKGTQRQAKINAAIAYYQSGAL